MSVQLHVITQTRQCAEWVEVEADVLNRKIRFWRFSPRLLVGYAKRTGNIDFYTWKRNYVQLGMTAEF